MGSIRSHNQNQHQQHPLSLPSLSSYDICPHLGFVSHATGLLRHLPDYYQPWEHTITHLPELLRRKQLKTAVDGLPVLTTEKLSTDAEWKRAYLCLAVLVQAVVFEDVDGGGGGRVPPPVAEPFLEVCKYLGVRSVLSYCGYSLGNWRVRDRVLGGADGDGERGEGRVEEVKRLLLSDQLRNVDCCASFTGTLDEKVFTLVPTLVEAEGGCMVSMLLEALRSADVGDVGSVTVVLQGCIERLQVMAEHLAVLHEQCDPFVFYDKIRPWVSGSQGMESRGLPDGFVFEHADGRRTTSKCVGASAVQSPLFQFLDYIFGIEHKSEFLQEMRNYMPRKHREFLQLVETLPNLRSFLEMHSDEEQLRMAFDQCVAHLRAWRTKHIGIVMRYVVMPSKRHADQDGVKGTGGSLPLPFLKEIRDETVG